MYPVAGVGLGRWPEYSTRERRAGGPLPRWVGPLQGGGSVFSSLHFRTHRCRGSCFSPSGGEGPPGVGGSSFSTCPFSALRARPTTHAKREDHTRPLGRAAGPGSRVIKLPSPSKTMNRRSKTECERNVRLEEAKVATVRSHARQVACLPAPSNRNRNIWEYAAAAW